ncbi:MULTISPECIES: DinB family protein [unclassified Paenibacillus]|uniref:DinB family protein n=1 Tax=unclassified Paenibacillus TaxID=185978 RepID=UPI003624AD0A
MFTTVQSFVASWSMESAATQRVMDALTDASLGQEIAPNHRKLGQLAWHLVITVHEMLSRTGLTFDPVAEDEHAPASAAAIAEAYRRAGQAMIAAIQTQWTDGDLSKMTNMYGEEWPNGLTLHIFIQHEIHHRGQMTVLMRQAGLRVPDVCGPTREDWIERGMQPMV